MNVDLKAYNLSPKSYWTALRTCIWSNVGMGELAKLLLVIPFLFLSGPFVNAGPVGDFFKNVGQSISKPFQPQPQPQSTRPQPTKTPHATRRATSQAAPAAKATPSAAAQPSQPAKE